MAEFPTFMGSWRWPWIRSYCILSCITHRPLLTYQISLKLKNGRMYGHLRPTLLGRLGGVDLIKIQNKQLTSCIPHIITTMRKSTKDGRQNLKEWKQTNCFRRIFYLETTLLHCHRLQQNSNMPLPVRLAFYSSVIWCCWLGIRPVKNLLQKSRKLSFSRCSLTWSNSTKSRLNKNS